MPPTLSIIVINYNTEDLTSDCIRSIFRETINTDFEVILFDNASSDDSVATIERKFGKSVRLISSPTNLGFTKGNNDAAQIATGEYLLLLNPDTLIINNAIDELINFAKTKPDAGIWGGRTLFPDLTLNPASCWMRQSIWSLICQAIGLNSIFSESTLFNPEGIGGWNRKGTRQVDIVSGCFFLLKHSTWKQFGGFHPAFYMYGEEADLCLRAKKLGLQPIVTSQATIIHYGGASETNEPSKLIKLLKAKILLIKRHFPKHKKTLAIALLATWPLTRYLAHSLLGLASIKNAARRNVWRSVWHNRKEWLP